MWAGPGPHCLRGPRKGMFAGIVLESIKKKKDLLYHFFGYTDLIILTHLIISRPESIDIRHASY